MNSNVMNIHSEKPGLEIDHNFRLEPLVTVRSAVRVIATGYVASMAVLVAAGLLLTRTLKTSGLVRWDERVIGYFADHRTPSQTQLSAFWSRSADAPSIVAVALLAGIVLAIGRNWREVIWLAVIVPTELAFFLTVSYAVDRTRPDVVHLGSVPSTGSFPSGHVAVTIVLYGTIAMILAAHLRSQTVSRVVGFFTGAWTIIAAASVGWARMYRGMHHPLDVAAGALLGCAVLYLGLRAFQGSTKHMQPRPNTPIPAVVSNPEAFRTKGEIHEATT